MPLQSYYRIILWYFLHVLLQQIKYVYICTHGVCVRVSFMGGGDEGWETPPLGNPGFNNALPYLAPLPSSFLVGAFLPIHKNLKTVPCFPFLHTYYIIVLNCSTIFS